MINVAVVSKSDARGGGASRVAEDLTAGLRKRGALATHFIAHKGEGDFDEHTRSIYGRLRSPIHFGQKVFRKIGLPDVVPIEFFPVISAKIFENYDVVHFHDLTTVMSPAIVSMISTHKPCFWTFHDCSPFTGGCFYPMDCVRYRTRCGTEGGCPQIGHFPTDGKIDFTGFIQSRKAALYAQDRVTAITPSQWMADMAFSSGLFKNKPVVLANGVDMNTFKPATDKAILRRKLGLPESRPIVLIAAGDLRDPRKGLVHSFKALRSIADLNPFALVVGHVGEVLETALNGIEFKATGYIANRLELSLWYSSADVFLFCSLADNQPIAILETMACGVPLVGFATGGIPEMIDSGRSGVVVPVGEDLALQHALRTALTPALTETWGAEARLRAEKLFSDEMFIDRHLQLYQADSERQSSPGGHLLRADP